MPSERLKNIRKACDFAITLMDERGRANSEDNSKMLWTREWKALRSAIFFAYEESKEPDHAD